MKGGLLNVLIFTYKGDRSDFFPTGASFIAKTCYPNIYDKVHPYWTLSTEQIGLELIIF